MQIENDGGGSWWIKAGPFEIHTYRDGSPHWGVWQTNGGWEVSLGRWHAVVSLLDADGRPLDRAGKLAAVREVAAVIRRLRDRPGAAGQVAP